MAPSLCKVAFWAAAAIAVATAQDCAEGDIACIAARARAEALKKMGKDAADNQGPEDRPTVKPPTPALPETPEEDRTVEDESRTAESRTEEESRTVESRTVESRDTDRDDVRDMGRDDVRGTGRDDVRGTGRDERGSGSDREVVPDRPGWSGPNRPGRGGPGGRTEEEETSVDCDPEYPRDCDPEVLEKLLEEMENPEPSTEEPSFPSVYPPIPKHFCPKGWAEHADGDCYRYFGGEIVADESNEDKEKKGQLTFSGTTSAAYGCQNRNYALLLNDLDFEMDETLEKFVISLLPDPKSNFWLDTRDWTKEYTKEDSKGRTSVDRSAWLPYICKLYKTNSPTSLVGEFKDNKCTCDLDHFDEYCGKIGHMKYCCPHKNCKPRPNSPKVWIPGDVCQISEDQGPCNTRMCAARGIKPGEPGYCTEDCPCFEGDGPCRADFDCWGEKCVDGVCLSGNALAISREDFGRPLFICQAHDECPTGMYCDTRQGCYPCGRDEGVSLRTCDALDGDCCSEVFLKQCPGDPALCSGQEVAAKAAEAIEDAEKQLEKALEEGVQDIEKKVEELANELEKEVEKEVEIEKGQAKGAAETATKAAVAAEVVEKVQEKADGKPVCKLVKKFKSKCGKADRKKIGFAMQGKKGKCKAVKGCAADKETKFGGDKAELFKNKKACKKAKKKCLVPKAEGGKKKKGSKKNGGD